MSLTPAWRERVVDRSIARSEKTVRARGIAPANRILQAAIALSIETGGASFSIQDVVDRADLALKTFYRHFGSKDALLLAMLEESIFQGVVQIREHASAHTDPLEQLRVIVTHPILTYDEQPSGYDLAVVREHSRLMELFPMEVEQAVGHYRTLLESAISRCSEAGRLPHCDAHQASDVITAVVLSMYHRLRLKASMQPPEAAAEYSWNFCLRALRGSPDGAPEEDTL